MKAAQSFKIKDYVLKNRVVLPPMCMYQVENEDGIPTDFHLAHYGARAIGQVGLIIVESTAISHTAKITAKDLGLYNKKQALAHKKIVSFVKEQGSVIGVQINHAGRKSQILPTVAPSAIAFGNLPMPHELSVDQIAKIVKQFGKAAKNALLAGYDLVEIHAAHGYLINQFCSPLTNQRKDEYGQKDRFLKEVIKEVKKNWPKDKLLSLRISAYEYHDNGLTPDLWADILKDILVEIDIINVSTGGNVVAMVDDYPGFQLSYAKQIKQLTKKIVMIGGSLFTLKDASKALEDTACDLVYIGRMLLAKPNLIINESDIKWPLVYARGKVKVH